VPRAIPLAAIWVAAVCAAAGLAYAGVRAGLRDTPEPSDSRARLADARRAQQFAGELRGLLDQLKKAPLPPPMLNDVRAGIRKTQQTILRTRLSGPAYDALLTTADRLSAFGSSPRSASLRDGAERAQTPLESLLDDEITRLEMEIARGR